MGEVLFVFLEKEEISIPNCFARMSIVHPRCLPRRVFFVALLCLVYANASIPCVRYLRVVSRPSSMICVREVVVLDNLGANVALGRPVNMSSRYNATALGPELAVDGDWSLIQYERGFAATSMSVDTNQSLEIDLGAGYRVSQIRIYNRADTTYGDLLIGAYIELYSGRNVSASAVLGPLTGDAEQQFITNYSYACTASVERSRTSSVSKSLSFQLPVPTTQQPTTVMPTTTTTTAMPTTTPAPPTTTTEQITSPAPSTTIAPQSTLASMTTTTAPSSSSTPAPTAFTALVDSLSSTVIPATVFAEEDVEHPDGYALTLSFLIRNGTWVPMDLADSAATLKAAGIFSSSIPTFQDPLGFGANPFDVLAIVSKGSLLNLSLGLNKCLTPSFDDNLVVILPSTWTQQQISTSPLTLHLIAEKPDSSFSESGLVLVCFIVASSILTFLLDYWMESLVTIMQLQILISAAATSCATSAIHAIFSNSQWALWLFSKATGNSTAREYHGRLLLNVVALGVVLFFQVFVLILFACFGARERSIDKSMSRVRFPAGVLWVFLGLFQGSVYASTSVLAMSYRDVLLGAETSSPLALAIATCVYLGFGVLIIQIINFRVVVKEVYREPLNKSFLHKILFGGQWDNKDVQRRYGMLYEDLNGSSFWFFGAFIVGTGIHNIFSGMLPSHRDTCLNQLWMLIGINGVLTVVMFLRRPFRSTTLNFLNLLVATMIMLVLIAFATAVTCSRKGATFANVAMWFALSTLVVKAVVVLVLAMAEQVLLMYSEPSSTEPSKASPERRRRRNQQLDDKEMVLIPLDYNVEGGVASSVAYKPSLPLPVTVGSSVLCREIGFGKKGGLTGPQGPSVAMQLSEPYALCMDTTAVYFVDSLNNRIMRHDLASHRLSILAGGNGRGCIDSATDANCVKFNCPRGLCLGQRCIFVADTDNDRVRRIDIDSGWVSTVLGNSKGRVSLSRPFGVATFQNFLYISDTFNHRIVRLDMRSNAVSIVVGTGYSGYDGSGMLAKASRLNTPQGITADSEGVLYVADTGNHRIVGMDPITEKLFDVCGVSGVAGESLSEHENLYAPAVHLCLPTDVSPCANGGLLVVDGGNAKVWRINRLHYAHVVLLPNEHIIPRCVCSFTNPESGEPTSDFYVSDSINHFIAFVDASPNRTEVVIPQSVVEDLRSTARQVLHRYDSVQRNVEVREREDSHFQQTPVVADRLNPMRSLPPAGAAARTSTIQSSGAPTPSPWTLRTNSLQPNRRPFSSDGDASPSPIGTGASPASSRRSSVTGS